MHKPPPREDEQQRPENQPLRRRRSNTPPKRLPVDFHPDEHPEQPIARRASLYLDQQPLHSAPEQEEHEAADADEETPDISHSPYSQHSPPSPKSTTNKIMVTKRKRSSVYTPPPPSHPKQHIRPKRSLRDQVVHLSHNQPVLIITSLLIVFVIIGAIIFNIGRFQTYSGLAITNTNNGQQNGTVPTGIQQSGDPHELLIAPQDTDHPPPPVAATSAYLLDADTGATLYAYNPFMHLPMLSTTKLMTAVLAVEQGNLDQKITITPAIDHDVSQLSADSTLFGIKKGETYSLRDMLYGLLLKSGNDAAVAIADTLGGNLTHFVAEMNQRAQQLGLYDTHYVNPHGLLASGQYSSAHDLAILGQYSMNIPVIHQISGTQYYLIPKGGNHPEIPLINGNQFLFWYPGVDGGKPGFDGSSYFQVISCTRNHHHLIGVVMHTNNWWTDMRDLLNWGFDNFTWVSPHDVDSAKNPIPFDYLWNYFASDKKENTVPIADGGRYYIYTGFSVSWPILDYYDKNGGLKQFGYPISLRMVSSSAVISQRFEKGTIQCDPTTRQCRSV